jgi:Mn-dependent DtxR family transcriptional regulator
MYPESLLNVQQKISVYKNINGQDAEDMNIAKYLKVSPPIISSSVKSLIRKGYIKKVLNREDNRFYFLELTEKGIISNQRSFQFTERILGKSVGKLSVFDIKALMNAFKIVETIVDE